LVFAGVGLLLAGQGPQSPWAPVAFAGLGAGSWAARHVPHRARRGSWATPDDRARVLPAPTAPPARAARAPERGDARARPAALMSDAPTVPADTVGRSQQARGSRHVVRGAHLGQGAARARRVVGERSERVQRIAHVGEPHALAFEHEAGQPASRGPCEPRVVGLAEQASR
jgi:hypothetical protein